jgi:quercetin dioxygenase-like cupin family protein
MQRTSGRQLTIVGTGLLIFTAGISLGAAMSQRVRALEPPQPPPRFVALLATSKTVMDEPIVYPQGTAKLTTGIITLQPGEETGWHTHGVPLTGIVLDGELTVDYGDRGRRTFSKGQSIAEAIFIPHNGKNTGTDAMRLFAVFIGAEGVPTVMPTPATQPQ